MRPDQAWGSSLWVWCYNCFCSVEMRSALGQTECWGSSLDFLSQNGRLLVVVA